MEQRWFGLWDVVSGYWFTTNDEIVVYFPAKAIADGMLSNYKQHFKRKWDLPDDQCMSEMQRYVVKEFGGSNE